MADKNFNHNVRDNRIQNKSWGTNAMLLPFWKIGREAKRVRNQVTLIIKNIYDSLVWLYESLLRYQQKKWLNSSARPITGNFPLGSKVAIFVLFQPKGLVRSVFITCDHLIKNGYSIFIISNSGLSTTDRKNLLQHSSLLLERPNFGYDFGTYQDGIRLLDRMQCKPSRLILMNDSTWFPLCEKDTSIARMEISGSAFMGQAFRSQPLIGLRREHMESHFLMFDEVVLQSAAFKEFWNNYRMTSNRAKTIQFGEIGLTTAMFDAGYKSEGLVSRDLLLAYLAITPFETLCRVLTEACLCHDNGQDELKDLVVTVKDTEEWRKNVLDVIGDRLLTLSPFLSSTFIYGTMHLLGLGFVKKAKDDLFHRTRVRVLELEAAGDIEPLADQVRDELKAAVANWKPVKNTF